MRGGALFSGHTSRDARHASRAKRSANFCCRRLAARTEEDRSLDRAGRWIGVYGPQALLAVARVMLRMAARDDATLASPGAADKYFGAPQYIFPHKNQSLKITFHLMEKILHFTPALMLRSMYILYKTAQTGHSDIDIGY
ncbi:MAG: hypothetical protein ABI593_04115 [Betaproteobacteria bacterium]